MAMNNGATPMHVACKGGHLEVARWLHEKGVPFDVALEDGTQPMHLACQEGHLDVARWLHEQGAPLDVATNIGGQPMREQGVRPAGLLPEHLCWKSSRGSQAVSRGMMMIEASSLRVTRQWCSRSWAMKATSPPK